MALNWFSKRKEPEEDQDVGYTLLDISDQTGTPANNAPLLDLPSSGRLDGLFSDNKNDLGQVNTQNNTQFIPLASTLPSVPAASLTSGLPSAIAAFDAEASADNASQKLKVANKVQIQAVQLNAQDYKPLGGFDLPFMSNLSLATQVRNLSILLIMVLLFGAAIVGLDSSFNGNRSKQSELTSEIITHSQRMAKATSVAVRGDAEAIDQMRASREKIGNNLKVLDEGGEAGDDEVTALTGEGSTRLKDIKSAWQRSDAAAGEIIRNGKTLTIYNKQLGVIQSSNQTLLELSEQIAALKLQALATSPEIAASNQMVMLTQRIAKGATEVASSAEVNREVAFVLGKDSTTFRETLVKMETMGDQRKPQYQEILSKLDALKTKFGEVDASVSGMLEILPKLITVKNAEQVIFSDSEKIRIESEKLLSLVGGDKTAQYINYFLLTLVGLLTILTVGAILKAIVDENRRRASSAIAQMNVAEGQEQDAKRVNDQNQAAILRLMNELQEVADGDLTVQATVSEDITGAIADSVNYTVEELRLLVGRINKTAAGVTDATQKARETTANLLNLSSDQSKEITETGDRVLAMADNITEVSKRAESSALVAERSLVASQQGRDAVQAAIAGMNGIRDQIQDTSKRIKRLGESSQKISEIVEIITDITEQTNVLSLNAAIQAASAGEAGRGFTVVAEEVQRLAERSAESTKQIAALVRTIQTDTQDAVAAMERSTLGVVEGARLSDAAGSAITDVSTVSKELAEIILDIARTTRGQAEQAQVVAQSIGRILTVTEQTSRGTQQTANSTNQLAALAEELRQSVARFKVGG